VKSGTADKEKGKIALNAKHEKGGHGRKKEKTRRERRKGKEVPMPLGTM